MPRYRFRLEPVRRLRDLAHSQARLELAAATATADAAREGLAAVDADIAAIDARMATGTLTPSMLRDRPLFTADRDHALELVELAERLVAQAVEAVAEARLDLEALNRLDERDRAEHDAAADAALTASVEDLVIGAAARERRR